MEVAMGEGRRLTRSRTPDRILILGGSEGVLF
jgi:hypothetical protein